jgi:predicted transposase/invertase (TIGR01784 family)
MTDTLRFVFLELGRFNKRIWELDSVFDKWMYLLKHMHEMVEIPQEFSDPLFTRLFLLAKIGNFTPEELKQYKNSLENMGDFNNIIHTAVEEAEMRGHATGLAEGLEQGRAEGMEEGLQVGERNKAIAIARNLISSGMSLEDVARMTGLTVDEVRNI